MIFDGKENGNMKFLLTSQKKKTNIERKEEEKVEKLHTTFGHKKLKMAVQASKFWRGKMRGRR